MVYLFINHLHCIVVTLTLKGPVLRTIGTAVPYRKRVMSPNVSCEEPAKTVDSIRPHKTRSEQVLLGDTLSAASKCRQNSALCLKSTQKEPTKTTSSKPERLGTPPFSTSGPMPPTGEASHGSLEPTPSRPMRVRRAHLRPERGWEDSQTKRMGLEELDGSGENRCGTMGYKRQVKREHM